LANQEKLVQLVLALARLFSLYLNMAMTYVFVLFFLLITWLVVVVLSQTYMAAPSVLKSWCKMISVPSQVTAGLMDRFPIAIVL
jgi:hypothetical protein